MPANQYRKDIAFSVGSCAHTTLVPLERPREYPSPPMTYTASPSPSIALHFFGNIGTSANAYRGGTFLPSTGLVYCLPASTNGATLLIIDPINETSTAVGSISGFSYFGQSLAPNGMIYGAPNGAGTTQVAKLNPIAQTISYIGSSLGAVSNKYQGGVLAPTGAIYFIPFTSTRALKVDTYTDTVSLIGSTYSSPASGKWSGGVLAPNGKIYCVPYSATAVMVIDPQTDTTYTFGNVTPLTGYTNQSTGHWAGGFLGIDNKIYCFPYTAQNVLVIDPETDTLDYFPFSLNSCISSDGLSLKNVFGTGYYVNQTLTGANIIGNYFGALAANGCAYSCPGYADTGSLADAHIGAIELNPLARTGNIIRGSSDLSNYISNSATPNPTTYSLMVSDGSIIGVPNSTRGIMKITGLPRATPDMYTMPTNLAQLATSAYNRHMNR